jgi:putative peptidoglycan lipid II flippase
MALLYGGGGGSTDRSLRHYLFKNASLAATLGGAGVASGLILDALILGVFGAGYQTDALAAALTIPLIIGSVLRFQVPKVLIPVFTDHCVQHGESSAWDLLSNLITTAFFVLVGISLAGMALSGAITHLQLPGLGSQVISLAVWLSRILFGLVVFQGLESILRSVLYAQHRYVISSGGKVVANILTIVVIILWRDQFGMQVIACGMVLGEFLYVAVLALALSARGFQYHWVLKPTDPKLREILRAFCYPLAGQGLAETAAVLQNVLGSFLGSGRITLIRYAARIVDAAAGLLLGSIVQVTFPLVSHHAAANDLKALRKTLLESVRLLSFVGLPVSVWLIFTAEPMLVMLFVRGAFSRADASLTSVIVGIMVPCILLSRITSIAQTPFYARMDMRPPLMSTLVFTAAHLVFAPLLVRLLGVSGLPAALSLATLCGTGYMIAKLQGRFGPMGWSELWSFGFRLFGTSAMAGAGCAFGTRLAGRVMASGSVANLLDFMMPTSFAISSFIMGAFLFRLIDGRFLLQGIWSGSLFSGRSS